MKGNLNQSVAEKRVPNVDGVHPILEVLNLKTVEIKQLNSHNQIVSCALTSLFICLCMSYDMCYNMICAISRMNYIVSCNHGI